MCVTIEVKHSDCLFSSFDTEQCCSLQFDHRVQAKGIRVWCIISFYRSNLIKSRRTANNNNSKNGENTDTFTNWTSSLLHSNWGKMWVLRNSIAFLSSVKVWCKEKCVALSIQNSPWVNVIESTSGNILAKKLYQCVPATIKNMPLIFHIEVSMCIFHFINILELQNLHVVKYGINTVK